MHIYSEVSHTLINGVYSLIGVNRIVLLDLLPNNNNVYK